LFCSKADCSLKTTHKFGRLLKSFLRIWKIKAGQSGLGLFWFVAFRARTRVSKLLDSFFQTVAHVPGP
jgi:hypothetical protein